jgi:hypothetical protein
MPMSPYVEFTTNAGGRVLFEVDAAEVVPSSGVEKAGLRDRAAESAVASAGSTFEDAVASVVASSVAALTHAVTSLPRAPTELELTFALKATGEVGNIAIAKAGGEANLTVRLVWRSDTS